MYGDMNEIRKRWKVCAIILVVLYFFAILWLIGKWNTAIFVMCTIGLGLPAIFFWLVAKNGMRTWTQKHPRQIEEERVRKQQRAAKLVSEPKRERESPISWLKRKKQFFGKSEAYRFANDPIYREKIIDEIHKQENAAYEKRVREAEKVKEDLMKERKKELERLEDERWRMEGKIMVNEEEGIVKIHGADYRFDSIHGAEINCVYGTRYESETEEKGESKKHVSWGGAAVGGMVAGPVGAVVGGSAFGKTKSKTRAVTTFHNIPTCEHLGVNVNLNNFVTEIVILRKSTDQDSMEFRCGMIEAESLVQRLQGLAYTPVPENVVPLPECPSIKALDEKIKKAEETLCAVEAALPTYEIPEKYTRLCETSEIEKPLDGPTKRSTK